MASAGPCGLPHDEVQAGVPVGVSRHRVGLLGVVCDSRAMFGGKMQDGLGERPDPGAGVVGTVPDCVNSGRNDEMVEGLAKAAGIKATPTVRINGEDYNYSSPDELVAKIKEIVGDVPGLDGAVAPAA